LSAKYIDLTISAFTTLAKNTLPYPQPTAKMLIPKADRKKIHEYLFRGMVMLIYA
jgi:hypothetical protein